MASKSVATRFDNTDISVQSCGPGFCPNWKVHKKNQAGVDHKVVKCQNSVLEDGRTYFVFNVVVAVMLVEIGLHFYKGLEKADAFFVGHLFMDVGRSGVGKGIKSSFIVPTQDGKIFWWASRLNWLSTIQSSVQIKMVESKLDTYLTDRCGK